MEVIVGPSTSRKCIQNNGAAIFLIIVGGGHNFNAVAVGKVGDGVEVVVVVVVVGVTFPMQVVQGARARVGEETVEEEV